MNLPQIQDDRRLNSSSVVVLNLWENPSGSGVQSAKKVRGNLTPALSRWERENCFPFLECRSAVIAGDALNDQRSMTCCSFSPPGEGQGEGERDGEPKNVQRPTLNFER